MTSNPSINIFIYKTIHLLDVGRNGFVQIHTQTENKFIQCCVHLRVRVDNPQLLVERESKRRSFATRMSIQSSLQSIAFVDIH